MRPDRHRPPVAAERATALPNSSNFSVFDPFEIDLVARPRRAVASEHVHGTGFVGRFVVLLAVDALRTRCPRSARSRPSCCHRRSGSTGRRTQSVCPHSTPLKLACSDQAAAVAHEQCAAPADVSSGASTLPEWPLCTTLIPGTSVSSSSAPRRHRVPVIADGDPAAHRILRVAFLGLQCACCDQLVPLRVNT